MNIIFSSLQPEIVVTQNADGSYAWSGQYNGASIKRAIPIDEGKHCIILLDPDANKRSAFENLLCIDRKGEPIWIAKLPTSPDVFLDASLSSDGLLAHTWSGLQVLLNGNTGRELERKFAK